MRCSECQGLRLSGTTEDTGREAVVVHRSALRHPYYWIAKKVIKALGFDETLILIEPVGGTLHEHFVLSGHGRRGEGASRALALEEIYPLDDLE